jgi:hypothetical protein
MARRIHKKNIKKKLTLSLIIDYLENIFWFDFKKISARMRWDLDFADYFNFWQTKTLFVFFSPQIFI